MQLKKYQKECLNKLREYAVECRKHPPEDAASFAWTRMRLEKGENFDSETFNPDEVVFDDPKERLKLMMSYK